jgi:hypothetical protein
LTEGKHAVSIKTMGVLRLLYMYAETALVHDDVSTIKKPACKQMIDIDLVLLLNLQDYFQNRSWWTLGRKMQNPIMDTDTVDDARLVQNSWSMCSWLTMQMMMMMIIAPLKIIGS